MALDLVIRGGSVVDGSGKPRFGADVGIKDGRIVEIGKVSGNAARTIDADGLIVAPGFIDGHTHMDAQVAWDPLGTCSCWHGVTSVVMSNCGFALAPCKPADREWYARCLSAVEDIPTEAMAAGIDWTWETFPEYLATVERLPKAINYGMYIGHSALRMYVMGKRALSEAATEDDMARVNAAFTDAAKRSLRIGFDAIELHFAHGYLLHSFVSPLSNKRNDAYGGSFEGRMRFPLEVVRSVRAAVPRAVPLGARITGSDWLDGGLTPADAIACAKALKELGFDYVDISSGGISADARSPTAPGYNAPIAEQVKRVTGIATRTVGLIVTPKQAEAIVAEGKADMVALARAVLDNPHWGWYAARTLGAEVKRPRQYLRSSSTLWPGAAIRDAQG